MRYIETRYWTIATIKEDWKNKINFTKSKLWFYNTIDLLNDISTGVFNLEKDLI